MGFVCLRDKKSLLRKTFRQGLTGSLLLGLPRVRTRRRRVGVGQDAGTKEAPLPLVVVPALRVTCDTAPFTLSLRAL